MKSGKFRLIVAAFTCVLLGACATDRGLDGEPAIAISQNNQGLPPPDNANIIPDRRAYVIGPYDKLAINVFGAPELGGEIEVGAAGAISLPLVGEIDAYGLTTSQLSDIIEERLAGRYVREPHVSVNVTEVVSQVVTVSGEVQMPGNYPVTGRNTLVGAIAMAQGLDEYARREDVVLFRTVGDQRMAALYNLRAIEAGYYEDPDIFPGDSIVVGESSSRRLFDNLTTGLPSVIATVLTLTIR
jgi:polysaccharide export outer membrane protein